MKTILFLLTLIPVAATVSLYGFLESGANMVESLVVAATNKTGGAGTALLFSPIVIFFIAICLGMFIGVPLVVSSVAACLGGWSLRKSGCGVSRRAALLAIILSAALTMAVVLVASQRDNLIPVSSRPTQRPKTPATVFACFAGGNAILSLFVATRILCRITSKRKPPPIPQ